MGQFIMLGTLFGLIVLIFGAVIYFDPEAKVDTGSERAGEERTADGRRAR